MEYEQEEVEAVVYNCWLWREQHHAACDGQQQSEAWKEVQKLKNEAVGDLERGGASFLGRVALLAIRSLKSVVGD